MCLEDLVWMLRLHDVKVAGQRLEVLAQLLIRNDHLQVSILTLIRIALPRQKEGKLFESDWVGTLSHNFANELSIVQFLSDAHSLGISLELAVDVEGGAERELLLLRVRAVVARREQIVADALEIILVREVDQS